MFKLSLLLLIITFVEAFAQSAAVPNESEIEANILSIQQKLVVLKKQLNQAYGQEQDIIVQLEQQDKLIAEVSLQVEKSSQQLKQITTQIEAVASEIQHSNKSIERQKNQIIKLLTLQVYMNHDKTLRLLLGNKKTEANQQTKHQIKYLQNKLYTLIKEVAEQIEQLTVLQQSQVKLQGQESQQQIELNRQKDDLLSQRKHRFAILTQLKIQIAKHKSESQGLSQDQKRLQNLLNEIQILLSDLPKDLGANKPFKSLKGQMKKPVEGQFVRSFNSKRSENTNYNGVVIAANLGDSIEAIAYARVAFADWLRGFGLLVILDHQDGYMSLYGFNESLNVEVGDWVEQGQIIATIGNSGTFATPALYFEIRKDAIPLNPRLWVK